MYAGPWRCKAWPPTRASLNRTPAGATLTQPHKGTSISIRLLFTAVAGTVTPDFSVVFGWNSSYCLKVFCLSRLLLSSLSRESRLFLGLSCFYSCWPFWVAGTFCFKSGLYEVKRKSATHVHVTSRVLSCLAGLPALSILQNHLMFVLDIMSREFSGP